MVDRRPYFCSKSHPFFSSFLFFEMNGSICKNLFSFPIDRYMKPHYEQIQVVAAIGTAIVGHTSISVVLNPFYTLTSSKPIDFNPFPWFHIELLTMSVHSIHISVHGIPIQSVVTGFLLSKTEERCSFMGNNVLFFRLEIVIINREKFHELLRIVI